MKSVKILVVVAELVYSGAVYCAKRICGILIANGIDVEVWSYEDGSFAAEFEKLGIPIKIIDGKKVYENADRITKEIKKFDLVIANSIYTYALEDIAKNIVPTVFYIHEAMNIAIEENPEHYFALKRAEKKYTVSEYARQYIYGKYKVDTKIIHNYVEDESLLIDIKDNINSTTKIIFLALGSIEEIKAFDTYIDAYTSLSDDERKKAELHFAGRYRAYEKQYYDSIQKKVNANEGIYYHCEIQERRKLLQLIFDSDVVVVPSRDESCSLVALEAAMLGKPLIISKNVGAEYILTLKNGWIFETGNVEELAEIYRQAIADRSSLPEMGKESRKLYEQTSTLDIYQANLLKMVHDSISKHKWIYRLTHIYTIRKEQKERKAENELNKYLFDFPNLELPERSHIAIYAAGKVGRSFYSYAVSKHHSIVLWVDKNFENIKEAERIVEPLDALFTCAYDYIFIAIENESLAYKIKKDLVNRGIAEEKILWTAPRRRSLTELLSMKKCMQ